MSGSGASLQCTEAGVPFGRWTYTVTPRLGTFTGSESSKSASVAVATAAPSLTTVTAQNPATAQPTGSIVLVWGAVTGATGYNVYRRTAAGSYDFAAPLNGSTPISSGTTYTDPGSGLASATTYHYVIRAVAGSPAVESASSNAISATTISRPAAPATVTSTALAGAQIQISWSSVALATGYNVYRRTSTGSYNFAAPLNGSNPVSTSSYTDTSAVDGTTYSYAVRSVIIGAGGTQVESLDATASAAVRADGTAPPTPTALTVGSGGNVAAANPCGVATGTRFINNAGKAAVSVTATIATPETGQTVVFSATTTGSTPVTATAAATGTSVSTTLNLSSLLDGTVTITARTKDLAGNLSVTHAPTNVVIKDVVAPALTNLSYSDRALQADQITGTSECTAPIRAVRTVPSAATYTATAATNGSFTVTVAASVLAAYSYNVTATDLAGNVSPISVVSGNSLL